MRTRVAFISLIVLLSVLVSSMSVLAAASDGDYDFSKPASSYNTSVNSAELLEDYLGTALGEKEYSYLSSFGALTLSYNSNIQTSNIQTSYENGILNVFALPYSYVAENGSTVHWTPVSVTYKQETKPLSKSGGAYVESFLYSDGDEELYPSIKVAYRAEFSLSKSAINSIINQAYHDAEYYIGHIEFMRQKYESDLAAHQNAETLYTQYLAELSEYEAEYAVYLDYLSKKAAYDEAVRAYEEYLSDLEKYQKDKVAYAKYLVDMEAYRKALAEYLVYLERLEDYNEVLALYTEYTEKIETVKYQISILDSVKTSNLNRTVYDAIMGGTVTSVLENKSALVNPVIGANGLVIDLAGEATESLRNHFKLYFELETEEEKYAYYSTNYDAIRNDFRNLLIALDNLYSAPEHRKVRAFIKDSENNRGEKYLILVCQLAAVTNALWDSDVVSYDKKYTYAPSWSIEGRTVRETLSEGDIIEDKGRGTPLSSGYPTTAPEKPTSPDFIPEPKKPDAVSVPILPETVEMPTGEEPTAVPEPQRPAEVKNPGAPPSPYSPPSEALGIIEAYGSGELALRPTSDVAYVYAVTETVTKTVFGVESITVIYSDLGGTPLYTTVVDRGSRPEYVGDLPTKPEDSRATYTFSHWVDFKGEEPSFDVGNESLVLYPAFSEQLKSYEIGFTVDGVRYTTVSVWGSMPEPPILPEREGDNLYFYTFKDWDTPLAPVTGAAEYTATFERGYLVPVGAVGATTDINGTAMTVDARGSFGDCIDVSKIMTVEGYDTLEVITDSASVSFSRAALLEMRGEGVEKIYVRCVGLLYGAYSYSVKLLDGEGAEVDISAKISVRMLGTVKDTVETEMFYLDATGEKRVVKYAYDGIRVEFSAVVGREYTLLTEYDVEIIENQHVTIQTDKSAAPVGERVYISACVPTGMYIKSYYAVDMNNSPVKISDDGSFIMPEGGVMLGAVCAFREYTITFIADGKAVSTAIYRYGDTVVVPPAPVRANDTVFSYKFVGWSEEIETVTGDKVYTAVYEATVLPKSEVPSGLQLSPKVMRILVIGCTVAALLLLSGISLAVFFTVRRKRKNK